MMLEVVYDDKNVKVVKEMEKWSSVACYANLEHREVKMPKRIFDSRHVCASSGRMYDYVTKRYAGFKIVLV